MYRYFAYGLTIDSELELPELAPGTDEPDVSIRLGQITVPRWSATIEDEIAFPRSVGRFHVRRGNEIVVEPLAGTDFHVVRALLQGRLMACLLRQRGCLPLHASGIEIGGQGVLFIGESGAGKSTTAAAFYTRGHHVLTDDLGAVSVVDGRVRVRTAGHGLRLMEDARHVIQRCASPSAFHHDKHIFRLENPGADAFYPVKRIYFLEYATAGHGETVRAVAVPGFSATAMLNCNSFLRSWRAGRELSGINLNRSAAVASAMNVHRLIRTKSLASLPELVDFVERDVLRND